MYVFAALGYIAGRFLGVRKESIAPLLIYMLTPIVVGRGALGADWHALVLPMLVFFACSGICPLGSLHCRAPFFATRRGRFLAFAAGNANFRLLRFAGGIRGSRRARAFSQAVLIAFGYVLYVKTPPSRFLRRRTPAVFRRKKAQKNS